MYKTEPPSGIQTKASKQHRKKPVSHNLNQEDIERIIKRNICKPKPIENEETNDSPTFSRAENKHK